MCIRDSAYAVTRRWKAPACTSPWRSFSALIRVSFSWQSVSFSYLIYFCSAAIHGYESFILIFSPLSVAILPIADLYSLSQGSKYKFHLLLNDRDCSILVIFIIQVRIRIAYYQRGYVGGIFKFFELRILGNPFLQFGPFFLLSTSKSASSYGKTDSW